VKPRWVDRRALILLHDESLADHGGLEGIRSEALLDSALARPENQFAYGDPPPDLAALAAAYGIGLARNHPFADGNKRAAFLAVGLFLSLNGLRLVADQVEAIQVMLSVAEGSLDETAFAEWVRAHTEGRPRAPRG
jgi:death on curing protein